MGNSNFRNPILISIRYNASVDYIVSVLQENTDYEVFVQDFPVTMWKSLDTPALALTSPQQIQFQLETDFLNMGSFGGLVNVENTLLFNGNALSRITTK